MKRNVKLAAEIALKGKTSKEVAQGIGMNCSDFSQKLNGIREFKISEAERIAKYLGLTECEAASIFFDCDLSLLNVEA